MDSLRPVNEQEAFPAAYSSCHASSENEFLALKQKVYYLASGNDIMQQTDCIVPVRQQVCCRPFFSAKEIAHISCAPGVLLTGIVSPLSLRNS